MFTQASAVTFGTGSKLIFTKYTNIRWVKAHLRQEKATAAGISLMTGSETKKLTFRRRQVLSSMATPHHII
eukprot:14803974-Heterocapsa_arctica.AAC.1